MSQSSLPFESSSVPAGSAAPGASDAPAHTAIPARAAPHIAYPPLVQLLAALGAPIVAPLEVLQLARSAGIAEGGGRPLSRAALGQALQQLVSRGILELGRDGYRCAASHQFAAFRQAALSGRLRAWRDPLVAALGVIPGSYRGRGRWDHPLAFRYAYGAMADQETVAVVRIALCAGLAEAETRALLDEFTVYGAERICAAALGQPFDRELIGLVAAAFRDEVVELILAWQLRRPGAAARESLAWAEHRVLEADADPALRIRVCEHLLWQDRLAEAVRLAEGSPGAVAEAVKAAAAVIAGEHAAALAGFAAAEEVLRRTVRSRQGLLGPRIALLRAVALLASGEPQALEAARRYCRGEARAESSRGGALWMQLIAFIEARLGDRRAEALDFPVGGEDALADLVSLETAAWLGAPLGREQRGRLEAWASAHRLAGHEWAAREIEAGLAITSGLPLDPHLSRALAAIFAGEPRWRRTVTVLAALADARAGSEEDTRLIWLIDDGDGSGEGVSIVPCEQRQGVRGWSRGKPVPLKRLARAARLLPRDAQVCQAIDCSERNAYRLDLRRALPALIGHPLVFFAGDLATPVELVPGEPELVIERRAGGAHLRLESRLSGLGVHAGAAALGAASSSGESGDADPCFLVRESATRATVIRLTAAHRRAALLIGAGLTVPPEGLSELKRAAESVAHLFRVHSEIEASLPESPADPMLHAELTPSGAGLRMRLTVRPFGLDGPRFRPGHGGTRVLAEVHGEPRAAVRDLEDEEQRVAQLLEAVPALGEGGERLEWTLEQPQDCLELIESLQALEDVVRIEWPAGVRFRVTRAYGASDLQLAVHGSGDWLAVEGGLALDEGAVLGMRRLIELARTGGRYLPLGDAGFLALSAELRRRLDELAAVCDAGEDDSVRLPALAAGLLAESLEGVSIAAGPQWHARLDRLREAATLDVPVPSTLRAELRPYQLEGFRWLARLAHWGAGACLADDMGLGKTVQAIAMLLRRAPGGPALVVAPTSVCGNWRAEIRRFAPTLEPVIYGDLGGEGAIEAAGPFDVVLCSYARLQQNIEALAARRWHTLVLDEAQAVKNFATKRARAVLGLDADFRIATTGTPIENRLDELWMLFRFLSPGLLGARERFNQRFAIPIERRRDSRARAQLRRLIAPFILRRVKSEVLTELPPRTEITLSIEPSPTEQAFHEALRRSAIAAMADQAVPPGERRFRVLAELMRLRRACCDPRLVAGQARFPGAKVEAFADLAEELSEGRHKALVFSQFVDFLAVLRERLEHMGLKYQYLDGATAAAERTRRVAAFQAGEGDFFLISLKAGGFGLNLTAADYVIITDPWWNPAVEDQAAGRAHRMGQQRPVTVYRLVLKGSIEERVMDLHRDKRALAEDLLGAEEIGRAATMEELLDLMRSR